MSAMTAKEAIELAIEIIPQIGFSDSAEADWEQGLRAALAEIASLTTDRDYYRDLAQRRSR
jgi:hypothetical protein